MAACLLMCAAPLPLYAAGLDLGGLKDLAPSYSEPSSPSSGPSVQTPRTHGSTGGSSGVLPRMRNTPGNLNLNRSSAPTHTFFRRMDYGSFEPARATIQPYQPRKSGFVNDFKLNKFEPERADFSGKAIK